MSTSIKTLAEQLHSGEGMVVETKGQKVAIYKSDIGELTTISAVCTHVGCTVGWNNKDKTWDCPCHGARYSKEGKVVKGPAIKDLSKIV